MTGVLLVDDQPLVRAGLQQILDPEPDLAVVAQAADGGEALRQLDDRTNEIDVVLMDIRMRGMDGIEATRAVRNREGPPVLALTTFDDDETLWGAIDAGVAGFVLKEAVAEDIIRATRLVAAGGAWLDPAVTERVLSVRRASPERSEPGLDRIAELLTPREREVLGLMAGGANNPEIAATLHVGSATVKSHVSAIFSKLGARDRAGAIVFAYRSGLVE